MSTFNIIQAAILALTLICAWGCVAIMRRERHRLEAVRAELIEKIGEDPDRAPHG